MAGKKVLIVVSDADHFPMKKTSGADAGKVVDQPSGYFLMELAKPLSKLLDAGYVVARSISACLVFSTGRPFQS